MTPRFEHDTLVGLVRNVNPRNEIHGEEEVLAVDVSVWLAPGEGGDQWEVVLRQLTGEDDAAEWVADISNVLRELPFLQHFEDHKVNFYKGNSKLASLFKAKINQFKFQFATEGPKAHDDRVVFRIQGETDGKNIGSLCEAMGDRLRLEIVGPAQGEMDLDEDGDDTGGVDPETAKKIERGKEVANQRNNEKVRKQREQAEA